MTDKNTLNGYAIRAEDLPAELAEIAEQIGLDALLRLVELRGGETLYLPKKERLAIAARDRAIVKAFNGHNCRELARKHGLTPRWVRIIVANHAPASCRQADTPRQIQLSII